MMNWKGFGRKGSWPNFQLLTLLLRIQGVSSSTIGPMTGYFD
jgi:hypothetical protein